MKLERKWATLIKKRGLTVTEVAARMGITAKTFSQKANLNGFGTKDAVLICKILKPDDPVKLFFN